MKSLLQLLLLSAHLLQNFLPLLAIGLLLLGKQIAVHKKSQSGPGLPSLRLAQDLHVLVIPEPLGKGGLHTNLAPNREHLRTVHLGTLPLSLLHLPEFGISTAGLPKFIITHVKPLAQGTGGILEPAVEHWLPLLKQPIPFSIQHFAASNIAIGFLHTSMSISISTGPVIMNPERQDAVSSLHRLQNLEPSEATSCGIRHSSVQKRAQRDFGVPDRSIRLIHAEHVAISKGFSASKPSVKHKPSAPSFVQAEIEQIGGSDVGGEMHLPDRGWSAAGFPSEKTAQTSLSGQESGKKPPIRHSAPATGDGGNCACETVKWEMTKRTKKQNGRNISDLLCLLADN